jgi:ATP-dependent DNA helicase RecG
LSLLGVLSGRNIVNVEGVLMETQIVEHKKSFGKEVIISLVAFANTEGGSVVVGVDDDGNPCGLEVGPETVQRCLNDIKVATYPQLVPKARVTFSKFLDQFENFGPKPIPLKAPFYHQKEYSKTDLRSI